MLERIEPPTGMAGSVVRVHGRNLLEACPSGDKNPRARDRTTGTDPPRAVAVAVADESEPPPFRYMDEFGFYQEVPRRPVHRRQPGGVTFHNDTVVEAVITTARDGVPHSCGSRARVRPTGT